MLCDITSLMESSLVNLKSPLLKKTVGMKGLNRIVAQLLAFPVLSLTLVELGTKSLGLMY